MNLIATCVPVCVSSASCTNPNVPRFRSLICEVETSARGPCMGNVGMVLVWSYVRNLSVATVPQQRFDKTLRAWLHSSAVTTGIKWETACVMHGATPVGPASVRLCEALALHYCQATTAACFTRAGSSGRLTQSALLNVGGGNTTVQFSVSTLVSGRLVAQDGPGKARPSKR